MSDQAPSLEQQADAIWERRGTATKDDMEFAVAAYLMLPYSHQWVGGREARINIMQKRIDYLASWELPKLSDSA